MVIQKISPDLLADSLSYVVAAMKLIEEYNQYCGIIKSGLRLQLYLKKSCKVDQSINKRTIISVNGRPKIAFLF